MRAEFLEIDDPRWPRFLGGVRHDLYHRPDYVRIDARQMDAVAEAFVVQDDERLFFVPYLIRPCDPIFPTASTDAVDVVSPYGYPGMLFNEAGREPKFAQAAIETLQSQLKQRGVCSAFFRLHPLLCEQIQEILPPETFSDHGETVAVDLSLDEAALWKQIREGHRATIRKCQKLGYAARFVLLPEVLDEFLTIYEQTMNRVQAKEQYYFGREYFADLAQIPNVHCCIVEKDSTIAAACIFFETDGILQAHLGGTRTECLPHSPFHLTLYHASLWGRQRGNQWLHLGGGVGSASDNLLRFKRGFSPIRFRFLSARFILNEETYRNLVDLRARDAHTEPETLLSSSYFPAYRVSP